MYDQPLEGSGLNHSVPLAHDAFWMIQNMRAVNNKHFLGKLLTFADSLFDAGPRCEAVKDNLRNIFREFRQDCEKDARTFGYELAQAMGDVDMAEDLRLRWKAEPHYDGGLPLLDEVVETVTEDVVTIHSDDPEVVKSIAKNLAKKFKE